MTRVFPSVAGDAPIAALTARLFGSTAHLVSNRVSLDPAGQAVLDMLDTAGVTHQAVPSASTGLGTPQLTIVIDPAGTRTWFAWPGNAVDQLAAADLIRADNLDERDAGRAEAIAADLAATMDAGSVAVTSDGSARTAAPTRAASGSTPRKSPSATPTVRGPPSPAA